jgi:putative ABC transport system permease protein
MGKNLRFGEIGRWSELQEIVGMVQDTKYRDLREGPTPTVYMPRAQDSQPDSNATILIRSHLSAGSLVPAVKAVTEQSYAGLDIDFFTIHQMIEDGLLRERLMARLSGFFGFLAVILAVIGLYGVISYMAVCRRNEIGIRMALGASRSNVIQMVMREGLLLLAVGLPIGAGLALATGKAAEAMLFELKPWDVTTLVLAIIGLGVVAVAGSLVPALRASRLDPMTALRDE